MMPVEDALLISVVHCSAMRSASAHHIRLVIPLTDYYHSGKHMFTACMNVREEMAKLVQGT